MIVITNDGESGLVCNKMQQFIFEGLQIKSYY